MAENENTDIFSANKSPNVAIVEHYGIQRAIFTVLFCSSVWWRDEEAVVYTASWV